MPSSNEIATLRAEVAEARQMTAKLNRRLAAKGLPVMSRIHPEFMRDVNTQLTAIDQLWHTLATIKRIERDFWWRLYERWQARICAPDGYGRKRDRASFESDCVGAESV